MCGIVGALRLGNGWTPDQISLRRMLGTIRHRGPDAFGIYLDDEAGLGHARLSIIDLTSGNQPIHNEDETLWIVYNGEVFNYEALRRDLIARGHRFYTSSDTEVVVHLFEERGEDCFELLNGQFALAIWDSREHRLVLARDRLGVRPLYYARVDGGLVFASEIKAILTDGRVSREIDPRTLGHVFTLWAPLPGHSAFRNVQELPPGHTLTVRGDVLRLRSYWSLEFPKMHEVQDGSDADHIEAFRELLVDATRLRLRADVPVGAYLSGGLDSSAVAAITRALNPHQLHTFSISFEDPAYDESLYQQRMVQHLGVRHRTVFCTDADVARVFPDVIWHCETPILRTAPAPLYLLSRLVRDSGFKVVLTGEGADEFLAGYNIFKEDKVRRFWARNPGSRLRPSLLRRLYPYVDDLQRQGQPYLKAFFGNGLTETHVRGYSHLLRWRNTARLMRLFSDDLRAHLSSCDIEADVERIYDDCLLDWHPLSQAQWIEAKVFLSQYLLSAQGDRMAMAHSVEGRFPFLDHRVVELSNRLPPSLKLRGLDEKYILKQAVKDLVPREIRSRPKQPYRAPIFRAFFGEGSPDYVSELLAPSSIQKTGYFDARAVTRLVEKCQRATALSEMDSMAVAGVLSVQLLHHLFVEDFHRRSRTSLPLLDVLISRSSGRIASTDSVPVALRSRGGTRDL